MQGGKTNQLKTKPSVYNVIQHNKQEMHEVHCKAAVLVTHTHTHTHTHTYIHTHTHTHIHTHIHAHTQLQHNNTEIINAINNAVSFWVKIEKGAEWL